MVDTFDAIRPIMSRATMLAPLEPDGIDLRVQAHAHPVAVINDLRLERLAAARKLP